MYHVSSANLAIFIIYINFIDIIKSMSHFSEFITFFLTMLADIKFEERIIGWILTILLKLFIKICINNVCMLNDFGDKLILSVKKNSFLFMVLKSVHNRSFFHHMVLDDFFSRNRCILFEYHSRI